MRSLFVPDPPKKDKKHGGRALAIRMHLNVHDQSIQNLIRGLSVQTSQNLDSVGYFRYETGLMLTGSIAATGRIRAPTQVLALWMTVPVPLTRPGANATVTVRRHVRTIWYRLIKRRKLTCHTGPRRWKGCRCYRKARDLCRTVFCPCFKNGRECDAELCTKCDRYVVY